MSTRFRLTPPEPREAQVLRAVLQVLAHHPRVAWAHRMQSGAGRLVRKGGASQFLRFGFPGCPDVLGQLRTGQVLAVECKRPSGKTTDEQAAFLRLVADHGGVALVARSADDVVAALGGNQ